MAWRLLIVLILVAPAMAAETVYRQTDEQGRPVFTDQPETGAAPVDLSPVNVTPAVTPRQTDTPEQSEVGEYRAFEIVQPQAIVPNGLAENRVVVRLEPPLRDGHRLRVLVDGAAVATGERSELTIGQLPRGSHTLEVQLLEGNTQRVLRSARRDIFVYWPGGNR